ncbi:P-loop containing nucleoside triphosphate hydrolase protein [Stachybotrys elegans]|uniref:P-loop containing nucleoside triphosphate hydrolase protein n=1 Tax=Stachybotrys elegans TaxID=80388 RepID=A0A8K0SP74_9HYPO|nr:P-loop containing nucleoside triphosphate hydrolase protein [Stachybotrys elegans]
MGDEIALTRLETDEKARASSSPKPDSKPPQREPAFADYLRIFTYATKWDLAVYVIASFASLGAGIALPLMIVVFGQLVGDFTDYFRDSAAVSREAFEDILNRQALYILALFLGRWVLNTINTFCFRMIGIRLSSAIRLHYLRSLLSQPIHVIDTMPTGAPATAITSTSNTLQLGISERLGTFLQFNATIWGALIIAFVWNWQLTLVTSSLIVYLLVVLGLCLPAYLKCHTAATTADTQANAIASEALGGIRLIMAFGAYQKVLSRHAKFVQEALGHMKKGGPILSLELGLIWFGMYGAFGLAFWYGTQRYVDGALDGPGVVVVVLMSVMMVLTSLERVSTPILAVSNATIAACTFFTVIDAKAPEGGTRQIELDSADFVFEDVAFAYPGRPTVKVLDGLNLRIKSGQSTALVGPSGSGKSTIVGLIARWYSLQGAYVVPQVKASIKKIPEGAAADGGEEGESDEAGDEPFMGEPVQLSGSIKVGDCSLEELDHYWWRRQIAIVQQEPFLFNDTIFGNVANGLIGTEWEKETEARKRELVQEACQEAYAHEFISRLPDGYDTLVGDGGAKLSGGQKQRIAIARSIVKKPKIIILDEATSALDTKSEKVVQAALDRISRDRTTITIAHRLSTIMKADEIIVLDKGRAIEQGTHQSLMSTSGVYSRLVRAQTLSTGLLEATPSAAPVYESNEEAEVLSVDASSSPAPDGVVKPLEEEKPRSLVNSFGVLLYRQRAQWTYYMGIIVSAMAVAAGTPLQAWLFSQVINVFLLDRSELSSESSFWALMWLALASGVGIAYFFAGFTGLRVQAEVSAAYKKSYFRDIMHQRLNFFDKDSNSQGTLSSQIAGDAKQLEELMGINMAFFFVGIFTVIGCIIIALIFAWRLALIATFVTMPIMLAAGYRKFRHETQFNAMNAAVFKESSQFATEAIGAIRTVSALTMETTIIDRYQKLLDDHVTAAYRKARWVSILYGFADSVGLGCQALVFWYGGRLLMDGEYALEAFFVCFMAVIYGAESASQAISIAPNAAQAVAAANRILDMDQSTSYRDFNEKEGAEPSLKSAEPLQFDLRNLSFKYPTRDVPVFKSLNLSFEKGKYVALVGPSGCGKSTIIALLERFYDLEPAQGAILCNGVNINDMNQHSYRRELALVPQEPMLFRGSIRDNILFGISDPSSIPEERIHEVCKDTFIHDFIVSLPEGYNTNVGQKGISMSGGQKQRLAIARALIRDPKVLLLDEATSALDSESEKVVQAAIEKARVGRTMIVVAHRLSTIHDADVIVVFDEGRVVEKGTHNELLHKRGVYWEMCESQSLNK